MATERDRLVDRIQVAQSQPAHLARVALLQADLRPAPVRGADPGAGARSARSGRPALRALHAERVHPAGAALVLVGDVQPEQALDAAERALGGWTRRRARGRAAARPRRWSPGPLLLVDRPGSVQSSLRMALPAVPRTHPDHAALQLANLIFGGYFSSRWVENIREDKGYTYGPHSVIEHSVAGSVLVAAAEVATEVTAPGAAGDAVRAGPAGRRCRRSRRSWSRPASTPWARSSSACPPRPGWPALASAYAGNGLRLDFLAEHAARLAEGDRGRRRRRRRPATWPRPGRSTVVLGDAERVGRAAGRADPVDRVGVSERTEPGAWSAA